MECKCSSEMMTLDCEDCVTKDHEPKIQWLHCPMCGRLCQIEIATNNVLAWIEPIILVSTIDTILRRSWIEEFEELVNQLNKKELDG